MVEKIISSLCSEWKGMANGLRSEMKGVVKELRGEIKGFKDRVNAKYNDLSGSHKLLY